MLTSRHSLLGVLAACACLAPIRSGAQGDSGATLIPVSLVTALRERRTADERYVVGTVPPGWPASLMLPAPAWVMGGTRSGRTLVAIFADSTSRPLATVQKLLEDDGWKHPAHEEEEGFQSSAGMGMDAWCRDSSVVNAIALPTQGRARIVSVQYSTGGFFFQCSPQPRRPVAPDRLRIPRLIPPPGVRGEGAGGGYGSAGVSSHSEFTDTAHTVAMVAKHYGVQLAAAGWTVLPPVANDRVAVIALDAADSTRRRWHGTLLVTAQGTRRTVVLDMNPERER